MRAKLFFSLLLVSTLMVGCATRQPFVYQYPASPVHAASSRSLNIQPVVDQRGGSNILDKVLFIPGGLNEIVAREVESTGQFARTVQLTNGVAEAKQDFFLTVTLRRLDWEIPRHDQMVETVFALSLFTGGIGGLIYGSTSTDVLGHAQIGFKLSGPSGDNVLLEREYTGDVTKRVTKLSCDTPNTGRELAGLAAKNVMEQFTHDLKGLTLEH